MPFLISLKERETQLKYKYRGNRILIKEVSMATQPATNPSWTGATNAAWMFALLSVAIMAAITAAVMWAY